MLCQTFVSVTPLPPHAPPPSHFQLHFPATSRGAALQLRPLHLALRGSDVGQVPRSESVHVIPL
jgi:hypothetical protein